MTNQKKSFLHIETILFWLHQQKVLTLLTLKKYTSTLKVTFASDLIFIEVKFLSGRVNFFLLFTYSLENIYCKRIL